MLNFLVNQGEYLRRGTILALVLSVWIFRSLYYTFWAPNPNVGRTITGLLAGIVFVDLLSIAGGDGANVPARLLQSLCRLDRASQCRRIEREMARLFAVLDRRFHHLLQRGIQHLP